MFKKYIGRAQFTLKKYSPELCLVAGLGTGVAAGIMLARAHKRSEEVLEEVTDAIAIVKSDIEESEEGADVDQDRRALWSLYGEFTGRAIGLYGPPVILGVTSLMLILTSHRQLRARNAALVATVGVLERAFTTYRGRVVKELGEEADERFYYGADVRTVTLVEKTEDGKSKKKRTKENHIPETADPIMYQRIFDRTNWNWSPDPDLSEYFLLAVQQQMNDKLYLQGHVFLNDAYRALGFSDSPEGAVVGWHKKADGDNFVSFGLDNDINLREGDNRWILDFNVNGVIYDLIGE